MILNHYRTSSLLLFGWIGGTDFFDVLLTKTDRQNKHASALSGESIGSGTPHRHAKSGAKEKITMPGKFDGINSRVCICPRGNRPLVWKLYCGKRLNQIRSRRLAWPFTAG